MAVPAGFLPPPLRLRPPPPLRLRPPPRRRSQHGRRPSPPGPCRPLPSSRCLSMTIPTPAPAVDEPAPTPSPIPASRSVMPALAAASIRAARGAGVKRMEVTFPPVDASSSASLSAVYDATVTFSRALLRRLDDPPLTVVAPDATAAAEFAPPAPHTAIGSPRRGAVRAAPGGVLLVAPGFNVDEYIVAEGLTRPDGEAIVVNGAVDKVRPGGGWWGYYPVLFYPEVAKVGERYWRTFVEVFFVKAMAGEGGMLVRVWPGDWTIWFTAGGEGKAEVVWCGKERPPYMEVARRLRERLVREQLKG